MVDVFGLEMSPAMLWVAVGFLLLLVEVSTGTLWLLWPGLAALIFAGIAALFPEMSLGLQVLFFAALAGLLTLAGDRYFRDRRAMGQSDRPNLNDRKAQLVGRQVSAIGPFANGHGSVRLGDSQWGARLEQGDGADIAPDQPLAIRDVEGSLLVVAPI